MTTKSETSLVGIQTTSDFAFNWATIKDRTKDSIISDLMQYTSRKYIENDMKIYDEEKLVPERVDLWMTEFMTFLKDSKSSTLFWKDQKISKAFPFSLDKWPLIAEMAEAAVEKDSGKGKKKLSKNEMNKKLQNEKIQKEREKIVIEHVRDIFLPSMTIGKDGFVQYKSDPFEFFLSVIYWACWLYPKNIFGMSKDIPFHVVISLQHAFKEFEPHIDAYFANAVKHLLKAIEEKIETSYENRGGCDKIYEHLFHHSDIFIDNYWLKNRFGKVRLYEEQDEVIQSIIQAMVLDTPLLLFYKVPPANGKTVLSAPIARVISHYNKSINREEYVPKTLLYICYGDVVRNEVARLCDSQNVDLHFWFANSVYESKNRSYKTLFNPFKKCYKNWDNLRNKAEREKFRAKREKEREIFECQDLRIQLDYYLKQTSKPLPEMIIADLESAYRILSELPSEHFIPFFDEAFAASTEEVVAKIMTVLPKISLLVSATLPQPEEVPGIVDNFRRRFPIEEGDEDQVKVIHSTKQHIGCTFIDDEGYIFLPHQYVKSLDDLKEYVSTLKQDPLMMRGYTPVSVLEMGNVFQKFLPEMTNMHFKVRFSYLGDINHGSIRKYALDILEKIVELERFDIFEAILNIRIQKMVHCDVKDMLTRNAYFYKDGNTLHVAKASGFDEHVQEITKELFECAPTNILDIVNSCSNNLKSIDEQREKLEENANKDKDNYDLDRQGIEANRLNIRIDFPMECVVNSYYHAKRFGNERNISYEECLKIPIQPSEIQDLYNRSNDDCIKYLLSGIVLYNPEKRKIKENDFFLMNKDVCPFLLSTPAIVYGANMNITYVDIDESYFEDSSKSTFYQLIGRAGRKGRSNSEAVAVFRSKELLLKAFSKDSANIEAINVQNNVQSILSTFC